MTSSDLRTASGGPLQSVNWKEARDRMRRVIAANLKGRVGPDEIEDLVQECCVGLMRAVLRGDVQSLEALEVTIAKRAAIDRMRRRRGIEWTSGGSDPEVLNRLPSPEAEDDPTFSPEELQFYVREVLRAMNAPCRELFEQFVRALNLRVVAERLGISHAAARKRWERCRGRAREILLADRGPLGEWAREGM